MSVTKKLVGAAVFAALAYVLSFLEFPIFPAASFLKLDFSCVAITLAALIYGLWAGVAASAVKELVCFLTKTSTGGVGEIANFILTVLFILVPVICYRYKKGLGFVCLYFFIACIIQTAAGLFFNRFVFLPLYTGSGAKAFFNSVWQFILAFNLIKSFSVSFLVILFYKRLKNVIMKI